MKKTLFAMLHQLILSSHTKNVIVLLSNEWIKSTLASVVVHVWSQILKNPLYK